MAMLINDHDLQERLIAERAANGADRYDEVWDGVYMMNPLANNEHQELVTRIAAVLDYVIVEAKLGQVFAGTNLSDREYNWQHNYRVPDVAVFLNDTRAKNCSTHWCGAADFLVEIISPDDRSREKIEFYNTLGVRELLLVDRDPWTLELFSRTTGKLMLAETASLHRLQTLASSVVPLTFELIAGPKRPRIRMIHPASGKQWLA